MSNLRPHRWEHLTNAPKELLDITYCLKVAKGEIKSSKYAIPDCLPDFDVKAEDVRDRSHAFQIGYGQGWECEMSGRAWQPTPPVGLPVAWLPAFCEGVLSGADAVKLAEQAQRMGGTEDGTGFYDPFGDLGH